jgi:tRNA/rRNA methyltransferase
MTQTYRIMHKVAAERRKYVRWPYMTPSIILIRPQMGENIGSAARAMANFGVGDMRLVAPRDGWPNPKASDTAGKALAILDDAKLFHTAQEAVADCQFVLATTARDRAVNMPALTAREAMALLRQRQAAGERSAILFGPERTGLENEEVALADAVVMIPVAPEYTSLNLAQAVVVMCYEWFQASGDMWQVTGDRQEIATREELLGLFGQLEEALDAVNFWRVPEKKEGMWLNLRATLTRTRFTPQEIATWRGIFRALMGR